MLRDMCLFTAPGIVMRAEDRINCRMETILQYRDPETQFRWAKRLRAALKAEQALWMARFRKNGPCSHPQTATRRSNRHQPRLVCLNCGGLFEFK